MFKNELIVLVIKKVLCVASLICSNVLKTINFHRIVTFCV